jgi:hypothetical protein
VTEPQTVQVGDVTVTVDGADLRDIRWQGEEAIRRIYPVFQDRNWTNRLFVVSDASLEENEDSIVFTARGTGSFDAEPLTWQVHATISDHVIDYRFQANTNSPFWRNRLGMCLLHPMSAADSAVVVEHTDGTVTESNLPTDISPHQPFVDMRSITHQLPNGAKARVQFVGEVFEMEDHRNWTDASFKTYCTPISLPFPVEVVPGAAIDQRIEVEFTPGPGDLNSEPTTNQDVIEIRRTGEVTDLPRLGLSLTSNAVDLTDAQAVALTELRLDHLRIAIDATDPGAPDQVTRAASSAERIGARLRVASVCESPDDLSAFNRLSDHTVSLIDCWYVFSSTDKVTPDDWAPRARAALGERFHDVTLGGGTDLYFTELNREPPDPMAFDALNFSLNPQVHAFDNRTLIQNAMTQAVVAGNAARITEPAEVSVGPISLRPRFNPNATDPESDVSNTALPSDVDARQMTYFAANWTAMSVKYLAEANTVDVASYFEVAGWKGVMEREEGSPDPIHFPSTPGNHFPVWDVFAALAGMTRAHTTESSAPESVNACVVSNGADTKALIANWSDGSRTVRVNDALTLTVPAHSLTVVDLPALDLPALD